MRLNEVQISNFQFDANVEFENKNRGEKGNFTFGAKRLRFPRSCFFLILFLIYCEFELRNILVLNHISTMAMLQHF